MEGEVEKRKEQRKRKIWFGGDKIGIEKVLIRAEFTWKRLVLVDS